MRIAVLKPVGGHYADWGAAAADYRRLFGDAVSFRPWREPGDLSGFDLIMPLLAWGYQREPAHWYQLLKAWQGLPFANALETLRWNTNKSYLLELEARGISIVPTSIAQALGPLDLDKAQAMFGEALMVVKPTVSGGAEGTYRLLASDPIPTDVANAEMLIQPLIPAIAEEGEYSLFHFAGHFSHAVLKRPMAGDFRVQEQFGGSEAAIDPPLAAHALAKTVLEALAEQPLYARIDMVRDAEGSFRLMELELIEPALFLAHAPDGGAMFADAVRRHTEMRRSG